MQWRPVLRSTMLSQAWWRKAQRPSTGRSLVHRWVGKIVSFILLFLFNDFCVSLYDALECWERRLKIKCIIIIIIIIIIILLFFYYCTIIVLYSLFFMYLEFMFSSVKFKQSQADQITWNQPISQRRHVEVDLTDPERLPAVCRGPETGATHPVSGPACWSSGRRAAAWTPPPGAWSSPCWQPRSGRPVARSAAPRPAGSAPPGPRHPPESPRLGNLKGKWHTINLTQRKQNAISF